MDTTWRERYKIILVEANAQLGLFQPEQVMFVWYRQLKAKSYNREVPGNLEKESHCQHWLWNKLRLLMILFPLISTEGAQSSCSSKLGCQMYFLRAPAHFSLLIN